MALSRLRHQGSERCAELVRLLEIEEQTRFQAFQAVLMSEVRPLVYQRTVRSIIEKLLAKLETWSCASPAARCRCKAAEARRALGGSLGSASPNRSL